MYTTGHYEYDDLDNRSQKIIISINFANGSIISLSFDQFTFLVELHIFVYTVSEVWSNDWEIFNRKKLYEIYRRICQILYLIILYLNMKFVSY